MNADTFQLSAKKREASRAGNRDLESAGRVLGVLYGFKVDPTPVSVDASEVLRVYRKAGTSGLVELDLEGKKVKVIMKEVNLHPVRYEISHVDFIAVNMKDTTTVTVPIEFSGEAPAVETLGGYFSVDHNELEVKCLRADIPSNFSLDISSLVEFGNQLTVADLKLDLEKYEISLDPESVICSVSAPKVVAEETPAGSEETAESDASAEEAGTSDSEASS